jgi:hypothetical protein
MMLRPKNENDCVYDNGWSKIEIDHGATNIEISHGWLDPAPLKVGWPETSLKGELSILTPSEKSISGRPVALRRSRIGVADCVPTR